MRYNNPTAKRKPRKKVLPSKSEWVKAYRGRLREWREKRDMTHRELAEKTGISVKNLEKYETRSPLPVYHLEAVCRALRVRCWFLLTGEPDEEHIHQAPPEQPVADHATVKETAAMLTRLLRRAR